MRGIDCACKFTTCAACQSGADYLPSSRSARALRSAFTEMEATSNRMSKPMFQAPILTIKKFARSPFFHGCGVIKRIAIAGMLFAFFFFLSGSGVLAASENSVLRSPVNMGGPEDWPENEGLSTSLPGRGPAQGQAPSSPVSAPMPETTVEHEPLGQPYDLPAPSVPASQPAVSSQPDAPVQEFTTPAPSEQEFAPVMSLPVPVGEASEEERMGNAHSGESTNAQIGLPAQAPAPEVQQGEQEVIYVDEEGNPVEKPLEPEKMLQEAVQLMDQGKHDEALAMLEQVRAIPHLPKELLEQTLYSISDANWLRYNDNPLAGYEPIVSSTNEAMNANLRSPRVPDALLRLGLANVNVGNLAEASGHIIALMRRFPDFPGVAQGLTALGQAQLREGKNADAERSFGTVLDKYPESSQLQAASVGLAHALVNQKKDERAQVILEFISKRWPRYYINDPDFLLMQAENDEKLHKDDDAMNLRWLFVNLDPQRKGNAELLLGMADKYLQNGKQEAADFVYADIINNFPDSPAAVTSRLRMAEKGIYDANIQYDRMSRIFNKNARPNLWQAYNGLVESAPESSEAVLARLKQAMWLYWDKQYPEAMGKAADFIDNYPENPEIAEAKDVLWNSFQKELEQSLREHNYGRILLLWNGFPYIRERYGKMDAPLRYALSQGWLERGEQQKSFDLLADFLKDPMDPKYGEAAFTQFFNYYVATQAWDKILDLGNLVKNWKMKPELANQLEYAMALSAQNLNLGAPALNRWKNLANRTDIPLYHQAYATYFLAKDAENRRDIRNAYELNRKAIELFTRLSDERSDKANPELVKQSIASLMDICEVGNRIPEALQWVERYSRFVPQDSPEYPSLRFREARLYRKLGDNSRSQALLEDISKRFPDTPFGQAAAAELRTFDVSRDLQKYMQPEVRQTQAAGTGSTSGNWSSSGPSAN